MELSEEAVKKMITLGRIRAITLDTCIFSKNGNQFEHGLLARLSQFKTRDLNFVLSDVVRREVSRHVIEEATKAKSRVESAFKDIVKSWQISEAKLNAAMAMLFEAETPENLARRRLDVFSEMTALSVIESNGRIDMSKLLDAYFSAAPPFASSAAKKHEFPDAIALQALESWAREQGTILLAVSKDSDWQEFGKTSGDLVVIDDLALALSYFHQNSDVACARLVARMRSGELSLGRVLWDAVQRVLDRSIIVPTVNPKYLAEIVTSKLKLISVILDETVHHGGPFRTIDKPSERVMVVEAKVDAQIEVSANLALFLPNPTDQNVVPVGSVHADKMVTQTFRITLTFDGDFEKNAELKNVEVGVQRGDFPLNVDFGNVRPGQ